MAEYLKKVDLLAAAVEVEYLGRPRMMVSVAKIGMMPSVEAVPMEYHDKVCEEMARRHQAEILELTADRPQGEWIPCSERLPSEQGQYLVTFPLCNGEPWVYILSFNKGKFYETDDEWGDVEYDDVTAWMSLPKPWKGESDAKEP